MHGIIVDPGAATSLSGTEAVRRFVEDVPKTRGYAKRVSPSEATFTGVDGVAKPERGRCEMPLRLADAPDATWPTDLFGQDGSCCPFF